MSSLNFLEFNYMVQLKILNLLQISLIYHEVLNQDFLGIFKVSTSEEMFVFLISKEIRVWTLSDGLFMHLKRFLSILPLTISVEYYNMGRFFSILTSNPKTCKHIFL